MILDETTGLVLQVDFATGSTVWSVRVKQTKDFHMAVLSATGSDGRKLMGCEWKTLLARVGQAEDFWAAVNLEFLLHTSGGCGPVARA